MKAKDLKILVVGAGGIGGITAAQIARAGFNVEVVDCFPGLSDKIQTEGLHVFGNGHDYTQRIKAHSTLKDVSEAKDIIILATKANALPIIGSLIKPILKKNSVIVSLQNGICEEQLAKEYGSDRVIGCVVGFGATVHEAGDMEMTSGGAFTIGSVGNTKANHFDEVFEILSKVTETNITNNIYGHLYSKLIINSCITTLGAISGMTLGKMLSQRKFRNLFIGIIREAVEVSQATGMKVEKYAGKIDFQKMAENANLINKIKSHTIIRMVGLKYRKLKSSSLQSLETGRKTEIDFLNGHISSKAKELKINTPINDQLVSLVKEIEAGARRISPSNFNHFSKHTFIN